MDRERSERGSGELEAAGSAEAAVPVQRLPVSLQDAAKWLRNGNHHPGVIALIRRARRALPGDPEFGDPLSTAGEGGPRAAARAADRLLRDRTAASREVSLGALQVWQAVTEMVARRPRDSQVTLVFTDLVGFSAWSLRAGDDATLTLLRRVAQAIEPPLLDAGGRIVKRMGDGTMAVFRDPLVALRAVLIAQDELAGVDVDGYTPRMRVGIHTGRPQRLGSDWLGVDVNIAARVMERATRGGVMLSGASLDQIDPDGLAELGVNAKRARRQVFGAKTTGVPPDLAMYRVHAHRPPSADSGPADPSGPIN
ncbi:adenylate/guanylate cyclase domain-containing protein [Mycolicibacillus koreensis]|uniref:Adenylate/guanylate cyclase domain-containing protein n=1 Tax=Mycolicibacillus koreensis TaxID=1069220 RepID=A0A7I7SA22_9MYCO|nr:adenylate/guanylate cyclase domain-containing protein [Mycolicibacillus koreensis]BBY53638.1 adenylate/guanylate cyclase domain-containing protein [Mycolicibacillus koreensis]